MVAIPLQPLRLLAEIALRAHVGAVAADAGEALTYGGAAGYVDIVARLLRATFVTPGSAKTEGVAGNH